MTKEELKMSEINVVENTMDEVVNSESSFTERSFGSESLQDALAIVAIVGGGLYLVEKTVNFGKNHVIPFVSKMFAKIKAKKEESEEKSVPSEMDTIDGEFKS